MTFATLLITAPTCCWSTILYLNLQAHRREKKSRTWKDIVDNEDFYSLSTDFRLPPSNTSSNAIALNP
ncbi:MAG: hypothetical protein V7L25_15370 [Nostoc sp.]